MTSKNLYEIHSQQDHNVTDKWSYYLENYDELLSNRRNEVKALLEIGVQNGGSLDVWSRYFDSIETIVGCDVDPRCSGLTFSSPIIHVVVGDANLPDTQKRILDHATRFDIILDDGSHTSKDIIVSFLKYFPLLSDNGIYIIEDLHCSYWASYGGGIYNRYSSLNFLKRLADLVNREHWSVESSKETTLESFMKIYGVAADPSMFEEIGSIEFRNSMALIQKRSAEKNLLGSRIVRGRVASVEDKVLLKDGEHLPPPEAADRASVLNGSLPPSPLKEFLELCKQHSDPSSENWLSLIEELGRELHSTTSLMFRDANQKRGIEQTVFSALQDFSLVERVISDREIERNVMAENLETALNDNQTLSRSLDAITRKFDEGCKENVLLVKQVAKTEAELEDQRLWLEKQNYTQRISRMRRNFEHSVSWRITRPVRAVGKTLLSLKKRFSR